MNVDKNPYIISHTFPDVSNNKYFVLNHPESKSNTFSAEALSHHTWTNTLFNLLWRTWTWFISVVFQREREIEKFRVAVNVPPGTRVSFSLTYEELLSRRLGRYELSLGLRPGQLVQNISLDVSISERTGISFIRALPLRTSRLLTNNVEGTL